MRDVRRAGRIACRSTVSKGQTEALVANKIAATSLFGNDSDREIAIRRAASNALAGGLLSPRVAVPFAFSFRSSYRFRWKPRWQTPLGTRSR